MKRCDFLLKKKACLVGRREVFVVKGLLFMYPRDGRAAVFDFFSRKDVLWLGLSLGCVGCWGRAGQGRAGVGFVWLANGRVCALAVAVYRMRRFVVGETFFTECEKVYFCVKHNFCSSSYSKYSTSPCGLKIGSALWKGEGVRMRYTDRWQTARRALPPADYPLLHFCFVFFLYFFYLSLEGRSPTFSTVRMV